MTLASTAAHGIWFTEEAGLAGTSFHMGVRIWFGGDLDRDALRRACADVIARHPALRSVCSVTDGALHLVDGVAPTVTETAFTASLVADELVRPFDLRHGPLARFILATAAPDRHLLLFTAHHLVFDGLSKEILVADLAAAYGGETLTPLDRPDPPEADDAGAAAYWRSRWVEPGEVVLPGLRHVPATAEPSAEITGDLGADLAVRLGEAATAAGVTRFEFLLTAIITLLGRYADQPPAVGVDVSTRTPATAGHIGHFVNELPVTAPAPTGTFAGYAAVVRAALRERYPHRAAAVARALGGRRPAPALTPVSVSYRRRGADVKFAGVETTVEWITPPPAARNALHVQILDAGTEVRLSLQYSPAALGHPDAGRVAGHLRLLLAAAIADPGRELDGLPLLTEDETVLLRSVNATDVAYPPVTVCDLIAAQTRRTPDAVAVTCGGERLTYAELDDQVAALAGALTARGAGPGTLVAVSLPRSARMLATVLAVARCGAAYLPIDVAHPAARREMILSDARPVLVVDADLLAALDGGAPAAGTPSAATLDGLAYAMFTSGSTGRPKGVEVTHANLANLLLAMRDALRAGPGDAWLGLTSLAFDINAVELLLPLTTGGRVVIATDAQSHDGAALAGLIRDEAVTHVQATPSGWQMILDGGLTGATPLRVALAGGEALPAVLAARLRGYADRLVNVYGPTETTVWSTLDDVTDGPVTIGRPIANTVAYVLDRRLRPVAVGVPGELLLGGAGVARGYLGRPDLTRERFVPDPFGGTGERLYRTGDLVRWRDDGRLEFLGRLDDQVKVRGHRIELGEVEARLLAHPAVGQAAAAVRDDGTGPVLAAYVVAAGGVPADLRSFLAAGLPSAMLPGAVVALDRLPLTPNGKIDRAALPAPQRTAPAPAPAEDEDEGEVTAALREIWQEVLEIDGIGLDEDIFDLGGHSLLIMKIIARIRRQLGIDVPIEIFVDEPTIRGLAATITAYQRSTR